MGPAVADSDPHSPCFIINDKKTYAKNRIPFTIRLGRHSRLVRKRREEACAVFRRGVA